MSTIPPTSSQGLKDLGGRPAVSLSDQRCCESRFSLQNAGLQRSLVPSGALQCYIHSKISWVVIFLVFPLSLVFLLIWTSIETEMINEGV